MTRLYKKLFYILAMSWICNPLLASPLSLLPHQEKVLNYLEKNPDLHGLILYHALGAGKTITALSYANIQKKFPKTVILVPEVLKAHWLKEAQKIGLSAERFELFSYNNAEELEKIKTRDYSQSLVIIDEIQKFIEMVRLSPQLSALDAYWQLSKAGKVLLLTGTPIFNDAADAAYIGNLVVGQEIFPFHPDEFKSKYMRIDSATSLMRGYLTESKLMMTTLPLYATFLGASLIVVSGTFWTLPALAMAGSASLNLINENYPINRVSFRKFDANLFADFTNTYISYYEATEKDTLDYPESIIHQKQVHYTNAQVHYFMNFVDGILNSKELKLLLKDYPITYTEAMLHINSAKIQQDILARPDAGREIGNLSLQGPDGLEISRKFLEIEALIKQNPGKTAIYSSYYHNGILLMAEFLKARGYNFELLQPNAGIAEITRVLDAFNQGKNKILLIHPEITEGISLVGVEQFHILEPVKNIALEKQIIGRGVRYRSHNHLPVNRRKVAVYLWESTVNYSSLSWPTEAGLVRRDHWRKHYSEVNPNLWTNGIAQLDKNFFKKDVTPDYTVNYNKHTIASDMQSFQTVCAEHSLEMPKNSQNSLTLSTSSQLSSQFAVPLLYFNYSEFKPYFLENISKNSKVFHITKRTGFDFNIEIPHSNTLNVGFSLRFSQGTGVPINDFYTYKIETTDLDLGLTSRLHFEAPSFGSASFYWKNELDTNVFFIMPAAGLGLGTRQSIGLQFLLTKHFGLNFESGIEGRILKDTVLTSLDSKATDDIKAHPAGKAFFDKMSAMKSLHPFVAIGIFSSYY